MHKDITPQAIYMGLLASTVGFSAAFAIVLAGAKSMGATDAQATQALIFVTLGMGICSIWLPLQTKTPSAVAWSTPGAAFLAASTQLSGGFAEAVGAFIGCALLLVLTGFVPALGRIVAGIPKPVASALLAGVLMKLCFAPALALGSIPLLVLPVLFAWLFGLLWNKLLAMPLAVGAFIIVLIFTIYGSDTGSTDLQMNWFPEIALVTPEFTLSSFISISIPLYLVTMAGQNIPGFAVLELNQYKVDRQPLLQKTGLMSLLIAPFGAIPVNMSAITAAMMAGEDVGPDPAKRYWAAVINGISLVGLALASGIITSIVVLAPTALITAIAGLALIPSFVGAISAAFVDKDQIEAPALTFLITASGMALFGVNGAFWGICAGAIIWFSKSFYQKRKARS